MALRPNPPINRNCNSPLRGLPQSGYWQRYASPNSRRAASEFFLHDPAHVFLGQELHRRAASLRRKRPIDRPALALGANIPSDTSELRQATLYAFAHCHQLQLFTVRRCLTLGAADCCAAADHDVRRHRRTSHMCRCVYESDSKRTSAEAFL